MPLWNLDKRSLWILSFASKKVWAESEWSVDFNLKAQQTRTRCGALWLSIITRKDSSEISRFGMRGRGVGAEMPVGDEKLDRV